MFGYVYYIFFNYGGLLPFSHYPLPITHLPIRKHNKGLRPGISSKNTLGKDKDLEDKWVSFFGARELTDTEKALKWRL